MRLSADMNDPGYDAWSALIRDNKRVSVLLNGIEQQECVTADEEAGYVRKYKLNDSGQVYVEPGTDEVAEEKVSGKVRIEILG